MEVEGVEIIDVYTLEAALTTAAADWSDVPTRRPSWYSATCSYSALRLYRNDVFALLK